MESRPTVPYPPSDEHAVSVAEDLPELYRAILDRVAELERAGLRRDAGRVRAAATQAYSHSWDESAWRTLLGLMARAERLLAAPAPTRGWSLRRGPGRVR